MAFSPYPLTIMGDFVGDDDALKPSMGVFGAIALVQTTKVFWTHRSTSLQTAKFASASDIGKQSSAVEVVLRKKHKIRHDFAIVIRSLYLPLVFVLCYAATSANATAGFAMLCLLPLGSVFFFVIEKIFFGLDSLKVALSTEVATERFGSFCDGVFSIVMTLIVLDIDDSPGLDVNANMTVSDMLSSQSSQFEAYLLAFVTSSLLWSVNTVILSEIERLDTIIRYLLLITLSARTLGTPPAHVVFIFYPLFQTFIVTDSKCRP